MPTERSESPRSGIEGEDAARRTGANSGQSERAAMPTEFWVLWSAGTISFVGTGLVIGALPLLAASLTRDARLVSLSEVAAQLGWLLLGLIAGVYVDRWNRTMVMWRADVARAVIAAVFAGLVLAGMATVPLLLLVGFVLGLIAPFFENASVAAVPQIVGRAQLERANSLTQSSHLLCINLIGPPVGAALFVLLPGVPFALQALTLAAGAVLVYRIRYAAPALPTTDDRRLWAELREGVTFVWRNPLLRTLGLLLALINGATAAVVAVLVLYVLDVLRLPAAAFGWMDTVAALGGLLGAVLAPRVAAAWGTPRAIVGAALLFGLAITGIGAWASAAFVVVCLFSLGVAAASWNIIAVSAWQRVTPTNLLGRVGSVYRFCGFIAMPAGAAAGGLIAHAWNLRTPYLAAGVLILAASLLSIPSLLRISAAPTQS